MSEHGAFGGYADWPEYVSGRPRVAGRLGALLGVPRPGTPAPVAEGTWDADGVTTTRLTWDAGFGPRQSAFLLHPSDADPATLPGVLALHSHGGIKSVGAARMVDVPGLPQHVLAYRRDAEGGACVANDLARDGLTVLAPDAFCWGSRRFDLGITDAAAYDAAAGDHEHLVAKACSLLDTTLAGMVAHDDLLALDVLAASCAPGSLGVLGFSGGGGRAAALTALDDRIGTVVVVGMMTTMAALWPDHVGHSWLLHARGVDLPGLLTSRPDADVLVGYGRRDHLFSPAGMAAADALLAEAFAAGPGRYTGVFVDAGHAFTPELQDAARAHLRARAALTATTATPSRKVST
ncbi:hypothetical protein G7070_00735 [Propioniciclava coleopterorum]|uniref:Acetyl xylan esterase (AXE1) n=1 Tax=Propioniciclava coleopterorum TaxID=2714937 RepID=A0A6G7Y390_9ACTN|nr:hypothetical protein [Propioniciclava coleopterorum]QIK71077.1 hypothetical protein G7070_00735 [Propioniciclava coleopterorum]